MAAKKVKPSLPKLQTSKPDNDDDDDNEDNDNHNNHEKDDDELEPDPAYEHLTFDEIWQTEAELDE